MPAWIIAALAMLAGPVARFVGGRAAGPALIAGGALAAETAGIIDVFPNFLGPGGGFGRGGGVGQRRRRRRKALTNTDMKDALTIASAISKKAAENFILMRVRGT